MNRRPCSHRQSQRQAGAALLISLILLIVITLVGLAAIGTTILQNKAAANLYDRQVAFQAAEAAMRQAQISITGNTSDATAAPAGMVEDCSTADVAGAATPANACAANPFRDTNANVIVTNVTTTQFNAGALAAGQPQYAIQYMGRFVAPPAGAQLSGGALSTTQLGQQTIPQTTRYYRITARSGNPATAGERSIVTLQSTFRD